jgi:hypothetical protein
MADDKKPGIFEKILEAGSSILDAQIHKAKNSIAADRQAAEADFNFGKAVTRDRSFAMGSQGFQEKAGSLSYEYQRQMAIKSSIISAIVRTRQNQSASYSEYVPEGNKPGFRIKLRHEQAELDKIKEELFGTTEAPKPGQDPAADPQQGQPGQEPQTGAEQPQNGFGKAFPPPKEEGAEGGEEPQEFEVDDMEQMAAGAQGPDPAAQPLTDEEMTRQARAELDKRTREKKQQIVEFLLKCGEEENRPFESKRWTFDSYIRAIVWDSMVYDQIATERVPKEAAEMNGRMNMHHFQPVDGSTIRYASPELSKYKNRDMDLTADILYPEEELKALEERDALELDEQRLEKNEYKFVQLVRGKIVRAFTEEELRVGMRNPTSDIYVNGYSISELEMLVALVTSHLQTEFYNRSYFQQGFSAKGILHIKANLNRAKLEELRRNWNHMVKGNRNSFQTPIMAGMDEVEWIPLTQSHSEMEFTMWLNYLIRMICAIYQIDPSEIGYGIKDEGRGGGISGDNTKEKLANSKDKGFVPLMKFLADYINKNIVECIDPDYVMEWVGLEDESDMARIARQKEEVQWKKTLNEVRAEDGLPPIPGADHLVLNPVYFQWYSTMSEEGQKLMQQQADMAMAQAGAEGMGGENAEGDQKNWEAEEAGKENDHMRSLEGKMVDHEHKIAQEKAKPKPKAVKKSFFKKSKPLRIEYYRLEK